MQHLCWQSAPSASLPSPAMKFILLSSRRSSSLDPARGKCNVLRAVSQISGEAVRAWSRARLPKTHESPALIYSAVGERRPQRQVILEYDADGANKADGL